MQPGDRGAVGTSVDVSVIIPAHQEEMLVGETVRAARAACSGFSHEVIVVCDACTDRTKDEAVAAGADAIEVDFRQISRTRNAGISRARGRVLLWIDADTRPSEACIAEVMEAVARGAAGGGAPIRFDGWVPAYAKLLIGIMQGAMRLMKATGGCFMFCTAEATREIAPDGALWDEGVYASEEVWLSRRIVKRYGRRSFAIIATPVVTSGRKLRTFSMREIWVPLLKAAARGRRGVASRDGLELWYGPRRTDPPGRP